MLIFEGNRKCCPLHGEPCSELCAWSVGEGLCAVTSLAYKVADIASDDGINVWLCGDEA